MASWEMNIFSVSAEHGRVNYLAGIIHVERGRKNVKWENLKMKF